MKVSRCPSDILPLTRFSKSIGCPTVHSRRLYVSGEKGRAENILTRWLTRPGLMEANGIFSKILSNPIRSGGMS